jgi:hypothetical protein
MPLCARKPQNVYFYALMMFLQSSFLWALAAVSIPVIIHLFNFRRYKKVYFTNVRFLKELKQESKSRSRLKEILVLLCRCLAVTCLVLAFAQPVYRGDNKSVTAGSGDISIYIDNSFSMENVNRQGPLLEIAKTRAREIVNAFGNSGRFQVITNDFEGRHQRFNTSDNAIQVIEEIKVSPVVRNLSDVHSRQQDFLNNANSQNKRVYIFSDAQKSSFDLKSILPDTSIRTTIVPIASNRVNNVFIDTCWFEDPLQQKGFIQKLHTRIRNSSETVIEAGSAKLTLNKQQVAIASFSAEGQSVAEVLFTFECRESGFHFGSVRIEDYPVTFDDELFLSFDSRLHVSVCLINGKDQPADNSLLSLFQSDSLFSTSSFAEQGIDHNRLRKADVVILNQLVEISSGLLAELLKFAEKGGSIVIIPPAQPGAGYNVALQSLRLPGLGQMDTTTVRTGKIEMSGGFFTGVFEKLEERINLPLIYRHFKMVRHSRSDFETLLQLQNGDDFLGMTRFQNAGIYLFSSPLDADFTNFRKHALFVPTMYQVCFKSLRSPPLFYNVSQNVVIPLRAGSRGEEPPHIISIEGTTDIIPEVRSMNNGFFLRTNQQVKAPGFYHVTHADSAVIPLAFNYSRHESLLDCYLPDELKAMLDEKGWKNVKLIANAEGSISKQVLEGAEGKKLWKLFIILALFFVFTEVALLRLLR